MECTRTLNLIQSSNSSLTFSSFCSSLFSSSPFAVSLLPFLVFLSLSSKYQLRSPSMSSTFTSTLISSASISILLDSNSPKSSSSATTDSSKSKELTLQSLSLLFGSDFGAAPIDPLQASVQRRNFSKNSNNESGLMSILEGFLEDKLSCDQGPQKDVKEGCFGSLHRMSYCHVVDMALDAPKISC